MHILTIIRLFYQTVSFYDKITNHEYFSTRNMILSIFEENSAIMKLITNPFLKNSSKQLMNDK